MKNIFSVIYIFCGQRSAVSGQRSAMMMATFLKLGSLHYLLPFCVFKYFSFFSSCKSSCARVPVVFYLNMSKKGKKQDVNDDSFESCVKDCLETIQQDNTIGMISPFLFAINHRKFCSKRHLKNIILLNIDLCACVCVCVRACLCFNEKQNYKRIKSILLKGHD